MIGGKDAIRNALTEISFKINPKEYDLIIIGGPVWAWTVSPAIRTYLDKNSDALKIRKIVFFATQASSGAEKKFEAMQEIIDLKPIKTLTINGRDFRTNDYIKKVEELTTSIKKIKS